MCEDVPGQTYIKISLRTIDIHAISEQLANILTLGALFALRGQTNRMPITGDSPLVTQSESSKSTPKTTFRACAAHVRNLPRIAILFATTRWRDTVPK